MSSIMKTIETPSIVYASVVVVRIVAPHSPDSAVHRVGVGTSSEPTFRRDATRHHPVAKTNTTIAMKLAVVEMGRMRLPGTLSPSCPSLRALVRAL